MDRKPNKYVEEVSAGALTQLPHLDLSELGDRAAINLPVWDGENWRYWRIQGDSATEGKMAGVIKSNYLARSPHEESDVSIPFVEIMWQRASWPEILRLISGVENCIRKMGTSVAKMKHTYLTRNQLPVGAAPEFATTEFEYSIVLCRTVFDLLQEIISKLWEHLKNKWFARDDSRRIHSRIQRPNCFSSAIDRRDDCADYSGVQFTDVGIFIAHTVSIRDCTRIPNLYEVTKHRLAPRDFANSRRGFAMVGRSADRKMAREFRATRARAGSISLSSIVIHRGRWSVTDSSSQVTH